MPKRPDMKWAVRYNGRRELRISWWTCNRTWQWEHSRGRFLVVWLRPLRIVYYPTHKGDQ